jgi:vancomycin resistance protein YoaR
MKIANVVLGLITGVVILLSLTGITFEVMCRNRVYPGVLTGGLQLGGLTSDQAAAKINSEAQSVKFLTLMWGVNEWTIATTDIGLAYRPADSAVDALLTGRSGKLVEDFRKKLTALTAGVDLKPIWTLSEPALDQAIATIAAEIDVPAKEPEIVRENNGKSLTISAGENGQEVDRELLKSKIKLVINGWGAEKINIPVTGIKPKLSDQQVGLVKNKAQTLLGKNIVINYQDGEQTWELTDDQMLTWLNLQTGQWKRDKIKDWVAELAQAVERPPQNSTFRFMQTGKVEEFKPAKPGVVVLQETTVEAITEALDTLNDGVQTKTVDLQIRKIEPEISTGDANSLGINELIGKGESWFTGSITNRIFNLKKAADTLNGILVAPGEIFSFNKAVGEVSANTGYKQAYIIKEGKTILGDGGGVCQVSTTLFRAILAAGLPIEERIAHAYRVSYYEVKYQPGFDATVFQPSPDLKFKNDTQNYILIQAVYDEKAKYLSFELYGTGDGRKVEISKARIWEVIAPPPDLYIDDPNTPAGQVVQTEHAAWGAKVAFDWKVTRGEEVLQQRTFYSNYRPWQAVYLRGTKVN